MGEEAYTWSLEGVVATRPPDGCSTSSSSTSESAAPERSRCPCRSATCASGSVLGSWPDAALSAACTSCAAASMLRDRWNCTVIEQWPRIVVEVISVTPAINQVALERTRHRRCHHRGRGARQVRRHPDGRDVHLGQRGDGQLRIGGHAEQQQQEHQQRGRDRALDERGRYVHGSHHLGRAPRAPISLAPREQEREANDQEVRVCPAGSAAAAGARRARA